MNDESTVVTPRENRMVPVPMGVSASIPGAIARSGHRIRSKQKRATWL